YGRRVVGIAQQHVADDEGDRVHHPGRADAIVARSEAAQVLHRVQRQGRLDLDHSSIRSTRNLIWSPGASRQGGVLSRSNIGVAAQPMAFQPFGPVFTEMPACMPPMVTGPFNMRSEGTVLRGMKMRGSRPLR